MTDQATTASGSIVDQSAMRRRGYAAVAGAGALWGCWSLVFRSAESFQAISPAMETFMVMAVTVIVLGPAAWRDGKGRNHSGRSWLAMTALGVADTSNVLCFFAAMQKTSVAVAVLTHYLAPVFVALAEPIVFRRKARSGTWLAVGLAISGLVLLLQPWKHAGMANLLGAGLGAASAVLYATNILMSKRLQTEFSQREIQAWHCVPGAIVLPLFIPRGGMLVGLAPLAIILPGCLLIAVFGGWLFLRGLGRIPASHASVLSLVEPVVAVFVGAVAWHEALSATSMLGAALVLVAAWYVVRQPNTVRGENR